MGEWCHRKATNRPHGVKLPHQRKNMKDDKQLNYEEIRKKWREKHPQKNVRENKDVKTPEDSKPS